jgi:hypothetical protein
VNLPQIGLAVAVLQLVVTVYLSWRVYQLTDRLLELEEHDQRPGKLFATVIDEEETKKGGLRYTFEIRNKGKGRIEVKKHDLPFADTREEGRINANSTAVGSEYTTPFLLDPGESYQLEAQFNDRDKEEIGAVGINIRTDQNPKGYTSVTDYGAGNL